MVRVAFVYNGYAEQKIRDNGTFLSELRCVCGSIQLTEAFVCRVCGRRSGVSLCHRGGVWLLFIGDETGEPFTVLRCPHCDHLLTSASLFCERGETCLEAICSVSVERNRENIFEIHRCIFASDMLDASVLPAGVVMMCELPPVKAVAFVPVAYLDVATTQPKTIQVETPVLEEAPQHVKLKSREALAQDLLKTDFVIQDTAEISRTELYEWYQAKISEIAPQTNPLSRQAFYAVVREVVPNVTETHHRVSGKLQRFLKGIGKLDAQ